MGCIFCQIRGLKHHGKRLGNIFQQINFHIGLDHIIAGKHGNSQIFFMVRITDAPKQLSGSICSRRMHPEGYFHFLTIGQLSQKYRNWFVLGRYQTIAGYSELCPGMQNRTFRDGILKPCLRLPNRQNRTCGIQQGKQKHPIDLYSVSSHIGCLLSLLLFCNQF